MPSKHTSKYQTKDPFTLKHTSKYQTKDPFTLTEICKCKFTITNVTVVFTDKVDKFNYENMQQCNVATGNYKINVKT